MFTFFTSSWRHTIISRPPSKSSDLSKEHNYNIRMSSIYQTPLEHRRLCHLIPPPSSNEVLPGNPFGSSFSSRSLDILVLARISTEGGRVQNPSKSKRGALEKSNA